MTPIVLAFVFTLSQAVTPPQSTPPPTTPPPTEPPATVQQVPTQPPAAQDVQPVPPVVKAASRADIAARRDNIGFFEGVLAKAVGIGAERASRQVRVANPGIVLMTMGPARARGFNLDGYGLFFDVDIPGLQPNLELSMQQMQREMAKRADQQPATTAMPRTAGALAESVVVDDPDAQYTAAVITSIVDAMLDYSQAMKVQDDEWLAVALRANEASTVPGEIRESQTLLLRIKGADLAEFFAGRITRDEVRKRVQHREF